MNKPVLPLPRTALVFLTALALPLAAAAQGSPALTVSANALKFAPTAVGSTSAGQTVTVTNTSAGPLNFTASGSGDFVINENCNGHLEAGQSCSGTVAFQPTATGARSVAYSIFVANAPNPVTLMFSGTGTNGAIPQALTFSASTIYYQAGAVGLASASQVVVVSNTNPFPVTVIGSALAGPNPGDFSVTMNNCPQTLGTDTSCSFAVVFTPAAVGSRSAVIQINTTASTATQSVLLNGSGEPLTITSLSPASVIAGAYGFTLQVSGTGLTSGCTLKAGGVSLPVTPSPSYFYNPTLTVTIPDSLVASAKTLPIVVTCPGPTEAAVSNTFNFFVDPLDPGETIVNQLANNIVWDPQHKVLYGSVPSTAAQNGNSIVVIDASTGAIRRSVFAGSEPDLLAISDDGQFLYVALDGSSSVQRFLLPSLKADILVPLPPVSQYGLYGPAPSAGILSVAPGAPHTWLVSETGNQPYSGATGLTIYDDAVPRPSTSGSSRSSSGFSLNPGTATWGKDATVIYAAGDYFNNSSFYVLPVDSQGIVSNAISADPGVANGYGTSIHFDRTTGLVYADSGAVVNPATGTQVGLFSDSGKMVPDGTVKKAFFLNTQTAETTLSSFNLSRYTPIDSFAFPNAAGSAKGLIRFGSNGLAFSTLNQIYTSSGYTTSGKIYLYQGPFVQSLVP